MINCKGLLIAALLAIFMHLIIINTLLAEPVPDTGQTICSNQDYFEAEEIPCPLPGELYHGQDAQYMTTPQSYTKLDELGIELTDDAAEWVMVRDNVTKLIWEVKSSKDDMPDYNNPHDADNQYTWYDSNPSTNGGDPGTPGDGTDTEDFINRLNMEHFGGYDDWRLPTIKELSFIIKFNTHHPSINTDFFPNTPSYGMYWTSVSLVYDPNNAGFVDFTSGGVIFAGKTSNFFPANDFHVRAVRGRRFSNHFVNNGDGTITDTNTGLMWQQYRATGYMSWEEALSYSENLIFAGYDDWRLPNINELLSIVEYARYTPPIATEFFSNLSRHLWSSTSSSNWYNGAWNIDFNYYGLAVVYNKTETMTPTDGMGAKVVRCGIPPDVDCDTINDDVDNCLTYPDISQEDKDGDMIGDICDNCPDYFNPDQEDMDLDGVGNACDNCIEDDNPNQDDADGDGTGDSCDSCTDIDGDGYGNPGFPLNTCAEDICPTLYNPGQEDTDTPPQMESEMFATTAQMFQTRANKIQMQIALGMHVISALIFPTRPKKIWMVIY